MCTILNCRDQINSKVKIYEPKIHIFENKNKINDYVNF